MHTGVQIVQVLSGGEEVDDLGHNFWREGITGLHSLLGGGGQNIVDRHGRPFGFADSEANIKDVLTALGVK